MKLFVAGLSYKTAPVELREQLAVSPAELRCAGCRLKVGRGATSVGSVAVELAEKIFGSLDRQTVMIIGAGKMGEACIRHLSKRGVKSVLVSNRSVERAQALASEFGGRALRLEECLPAMV